MTGMKKVSIRLLLMVILSGCMKTTCVTDIDCKKSVDWNNPGFTVVRTIISQGASAGN